MKLPQFNKQNCIIGAVSSTRVPTHNLNNLFEAALHLQTFQDNSLESLKIPGTQNQTGGGVGCLGMFAEWVGGRERESNSSGASTSQKIEMCVCSEIALESQPQSPVPKPPQSPPLGTNCGGLTGVRCSGWRWFKGHQFGCHQARPILSSMFHKI